MAILDVWQDVWADVWQDVWGIAAALPTDDFLRADPTLPASTLTDFSLAFDLSLAPSEWWDAVTSSDGTRGRVALEDETQLASDWIDFDDTAQTGIVRFKIPTLATSGSHTIRIYPPVTTNAALGASSDYGSDNAYASHWHSYYPDGGNTDRTSNSNDHLTANGGITAGDATGPLLSATTFDGSDDYYDIVNLPTDADCTMLGWIRPSAVAAEVIYDGLTTSGLYINLTGSNAMRYELDDGTSDTILNGSTVHSAVTWSQWGVQIDVDGAMDGFHNGSSDQTGSISALGVTSIGSGNSALGCFTQGNSSWYTGLMAEFQRHTTKLSDDWINHEYTMINDNSAFWSGVTWSATTPEPALETNAFTRLFETDALTRVFESDPRGK